LLSGCKYLYLSGLLTLALSAAVHAAPPEHEDEDSEADDRTDQFGDALPSGAVARLGSVQWHFPLAERPVAFAPDGKTMTLLWEDHGRAALRVWDITTGKTIRWQRLPVHRSDQFLLTPDGRFVVIPLRGHVHFLDVATGKKARRYDCGEQLVESIALSPDGKLLAIGCRSLRYGNPCPILLCDVATGKQMGELREHHTPVKVLRFIGDGKKLLSASEDLSQLDGNRFTNPVDGCICLWDLPSKKLLRRVRPMGVQVVLSPDGHTVAYTRGWRKQLYLRDLEAKKKPLALPVRKASYAFLPDGKTLAACGDGEMLALWDATTGRKMRSFVGSLHRGSWIHAIAPNGRLLATSDSTSLQVWDVTTGKERLPFAGHRDTVSCVVFSADGKTIISGSKDRTLRVWDARSGRERLVYRGHKAAVTAVALSPGGKWAASGDVSNRVHVWQPATGKLLHLLEVQPTRDKDSRGITLIAFTLDSKRLVCGSRFGTRGGVSVWDPQTGKRIQNRQEEMGYPIALSPDCTLVASLYLKKNRPFRWWDVRHVNTGKVVLRMEVKSDEQLNGVAFSNDGKLVAALRSLHPLSMLNHPMSMSFPSGMGLPLGPRSCLYELASGKQVCFLPCDGRLPVFADDDQTLVVAEGRGIRVADIDNFRRQEARYGHFGPIECLTFARNGRFLATGGYDHTVLIWDRPRLREPAEDLALDAKMLDKQWKNLGNADARRGYCAVWTLVRVPRQAMRLLRERLKAVHAVPAGRIDALLSDLDSDHYAVRQKAAAELETLGTVAVPSLRKVLAGRPNLEMRRQVQRLLARIERTSWVSEDLGISRATAVLEHIGTGEARRLLRTLATGAAGARLTEQAREALQRLERRGE
jgi:WD40 repeat protein